MRRLTRRDDRGAVTILVVLVMPVLLIMAALVFDYARVVVAGQQTQNAADAAALAQAIACVKPSAGVNLPDYATNGTSPVGASCNANSTATAIMSKNVTRYFVPDGGTGSTTVTRTGTATWGGLSSTTTTLPIIIAACEWSPAILDGTTNITLLLDDPNPHTGCSSPRGGFSEAQGTGTPPCQVTPTYDAPSGQYLIQGGPGNDLQKIWVCFDNVLASSDQTVLVPLYNDALCSGRCHQNSAYPVKGYAELKLTGYFIKGKKNPSSITCASDCIVGDFIRFILPENLPSGTVTGGPDFGADAVYLIPNPS
jgi:hypothetical protein